jgi:anthranilate synthase/aminodeoxychorismate synthase-like glutamine amidotransferase
MILLIDNYDSFVYNLARYFMRLGQETRVLRNDAVDVSTIRRLQPQAVVISPGPRTPREAGCSLDVAGELSGKIPILGVCLGHQAIGAAFGGQVVRAPQPVHGRSSVIVHAAGGLFEGLPSPLRVARYHSLVIAEEGLPSELEVTASSEEGVVMALAHRHHPTFGVQFHPESILTEGGYELLANFLRIAGLGVPTVPTLGSESPLGQDDSRPLPEAPVTF